uniref:Trehalose 6-phosphate phosphatase n=1 Tax=Zea mays TaxID=4577 RepID=C0HFD3_MAIZE|nr:unknown [Zea mays]
MTKHAAYSSEDVVAAVAAPAPAGRHFTSFQALKGAPLDCKKHAAVDLSASGAAVVGGGPWFESMKASSPRRAADAEHGDWMEKHPSALAQFEPLLAAAKGKQIVMFLDYDGTLSPIVEDPDRAVMSEEMREAVRRVAEHFPTAIVSGRCRDKVLNFVKLTELYYAGSHGMDIQGPAACRQPNHVQQVVHTQAEAAAVHYQAASEFLPVIEEVFRTLTAKMESIAGARVEHNKYCLSVHFRCVREEVYICIDQLYYSVPAGPVDFFLVIIHTHVGFTSAGMECRERGGQVGAQGVPEPQAHSRQKGAGDSSVHQVGQGQGPRVLAQVSWLCWAQRRLPDLHRR